jgi:hypothetical protein
MAEEYQQTCSDREQTYDRVRSYIYEEVQRLAETEAVRETTLRTSLCANGPLDPDAVESALRALDEQAEIIRGAGWVAPVTGSQATDAIEHVLASSDPDADVMAFVEAANQIQGDGTDE